MFVNILRLKIKILQAYLNNAWAWDNSSDSYKYILQKQPPKGVLRKRCSENMQPIYRRTPMPKCGFNKVAKNYKKATYFQNTIPRNTFGWLLLILYTSKNLHHKAFITFLVNRKNTYVGYSSYPKNTCWSIFS